MHALASEAPVVAEDVPAAQFVQDIEPGAIWYVPVPLCGKKVVFLAMGSVINYGGGMNNNFELGLYLISGYLPFYHTHHSLLPS
jgi:hypothetical protein